MDFLTWKSFIELGVLSVIAYFYFTGNKKREEEAEQQSSKIVTAALEKVFSEKKIIDDADKQEEKDSVVTLDRIVIEELRTYEAKNIKEHNDIKDILKEHNKHFDATNKNFEDIKSGLDDLYALFKKGEDSEAKNKQYRGVIRLKIGDVLPFFNNEKLRFFIVEQCGEFGDWVMDSMTYMFNSEEDLNLAIEKLRSHCSKMNKKCEEEFSIDVCNKYMELKHKRLDEYTEKVRSMIGGTINDKVNRFFNLSILFMQDTASDILAAWSSTHDKEPSPIKTMDGLDELRRIEKKLKMNVIDTDDNTE